MKALEKIVNLDDSSDSSNSTENMFANEVDVDNNPDYVPEAAPGPSKGKALARLTETGGPWWLSSYGGQFLQGLG